MVDSSASATNAGLRAQFARNAVLPQREAEAASKFVAALETQLANGEKPAASVINDGQRILQSLAEKTTLFEFNFAQLLAEQPEHDADQRLAAMEANISTTQLAGERLSAALKKLA